jgi:hypothetical protein
MHGLALVPILIWMIHDRKDEAKDGETSQLVHDIEA